MLIYMYIIIYTLIMNKNLFNSFHANPFLSFSCEIVNVMCLISEYTHFGNIYQIMYQAWMVDHSELYGLKSTAFLSMVYAFKNQSALRKVNDPEHAEESCWHGLASEWTELIAKIDFICRSDCYKYILQNVAIYNHNVMINL